jgi:hypothetical protein
MREPRLVDWLSYPQFLTKEKARELAGILPPPFRESYDVFLGEMIRGLLAGFMGVKWVANNVFGERGVAHVPKRKYGFFELDFTSEVVRETKMQRIFDLTEMLYNLQTVPGFYPFFEKFREMHPRQFEGAYAELQTAKMLFSAAAPFRFVRPTSTKKGENYDFEIRYAHDCVACLEAKCRLEDESINADVVASKLRKARQQLPRDMPGIILFKIPQHWYLTPGIAAALNDVANAFLRNTTTIVSVKYYVSVVTLDPIKKMTTHRHAYQEITNPRIKFPPRNWDIFAGVTRAPDWMWLQTFCEEIWNAKER